MSRFFPKSLFGQTLLILLVGLIISHAAGSWIYTLDREQAVRAVGGFAAAQRITNLTRLVQETPRESRARIVAALSDQTFRVLLSGQPPVMTPGDDDAQVTEAIKDFLIDQLSLGAAQQHRVSASWPASSVFGGWHPMMGRGQFEPFANLRAEGRVVEREPTLVDDQERGPPVELGLDAMEQRGEHRGGRAGADQPLGLEDLNIGLAEALGFGVEESPPGPADAIGR
jgi:hypothetical protein